MNEDAADRTAALNDRRNVKEYGHYSPDPTYTINFVHSRDSVLT